MKYCPNSDCPHRFETGRPAEFRDGVERCTDCGTELEAGPAPNPVPRRDDPGATPVTIARFTNDFSAHVARAHLESAGLTAAVLFDHFPYRTAIDWVHLSVRADQAAEAIEFLETCDLSETPVPVEDRLAHLEHRILIGRWFAFSQGLVPLILVFVSGIVFVLALFGIAAIPAVYEPDPLEEYAEPIGGEQVERVWVDPGELMEMGIAVGAMAVLAAVFVGAFIFGKRAPGVALRTALYTLYVVVAVTFLANLGEPGLGVWILLRMIIPTAAMIRGIEAARLAGRLRAGATVSTSAPPS